MCDALSRNLPKLPEKLEIIVGHCLAHARRHFVEVTANFPQECRFVLESLGEVYGNDEAARVQGMSSEQRQHFHQEHSSTRGEWSKTPDWERRSLTYSNTGTDLLCFCGNLERRLITMSVRGR